MRIIILNFIMIIMLAYGCTGNNKQIHKEIGENTNNSVASKYNYFELSKEKKDKLLTDGIFKLVDQKILDIIPNFMVYKAFENKIYCIDNYSIYKNEKLNEGDLITLYIIDKNVTVKHLKYPKINDLRSTAIKDLVVDDKNIYLGVENRIVVYDKNSLKQISDNVIKLSPEDNNFYVNNLLIRNDEIVCFNNIWGVSVSFEKLPTIHCIDKNTFKHKSTTGYKMPVGGNLSHLGPRRQFGLYKNGVYLSDITDYHIKFYDKNNKIASEINYLPEKWVNDDKIKKEIDDSRDLNKFRINLKKYMSISFIRTVDFINDSTLLVIWAAPTSSNNDKMLADIWRISGNQWRLIYADLKIDFSSEANEKINNNYCSPGFVTSCNSFALRGENVVTTISLGKSVIDEPLCKTGTYRQLIDKWINEEEKSEKMEDPKTSFLEYKYIGE